MPPTGANKKRAQEEGNFVANAGQQEELSGIAAGAERQAARKKMRAEWRDANAAPMESRGGGGGGKGKGGGGGGGGIGSGGHIAADDPGGDLNALLKQNIMDRLSGKNPSFSEEILKLQKQKLFEAGQGATFRARMAVMNDAARRGIFRSGVTSKGIRAVELEGMKQYTSGVRDLLIEKARADHQDMVEAVNAAQQWLNGLRQYELGKEQNAIAREQVKATLAAAAMSAAASRYAADRSSSAAIQAAKINSIAGAHLNERNQPLVNAQGIGLHGTYVTPP